MNTPLTAIGVACLGYVLGIVNATTQLAATFDLGTTAARDAAPAIIAPTAAGVVCVALALVIARR